MNEVFDFSKRSACKLGCGNCFVKSNIQSRHFGIKSIANIVAKILNKIPKELKEASSVTIFQSKFKKWVNRFDLLDFVKHIKGTWVLFIIYLTFDRNPSVIFF